jgi:hypothetical protein
LKRDSLIVVETAGIEIPQTQTFSDYRNVDGVMVAFNIDVEQRRERRRRHARAGRKFDVTPFPTRRL